MHPSCDDSKCGIFTTTKKWAKTDAKQLKSFEIYRDVYKRQELVSIARVGRSLGVHLILATQKPSGVVDDQIWSNSRFKLALKVADRGDSMEMLRTADAAEITRTGRAYLQVGKDVYKRQDRGK